MRPKVYVSGPITGGNRNHNYFQAIEAHRELMLAGFAPMNPMMTMVLPFAWEKDFPHELWLECDFPWVEASDAILRLPGYSVGADAELSHAEKCGVPIFYTIDEMIEWRQSREVAA
jgi:hypothetical protein